LFHQLDEPESKQCGVNGDEPFGSRCFEALLLVSCGNSQTPNSPVLQDVRHDELCQLTKPDTMEQSKEWDPVCGLTARPLINGQFALGKQGLRKKNP
jgi:hypothetical protein